MSATAHKPFGALTSRDLRRWAGAAAVTVAAYGGGAYGVSLMPPAPPKAEIAALEAELAPIIQSSPQPVQPETVQAETSEQITEETPPEVEEITPEEIKEMPPETAVEEPDKVIDKVETPPDVVQAEPEVDAPKPEVVLPRKPVTPPKPKAKPAKPKPDPKVVNKTQEKRKEAAAKPVRQIPKADPGQQGREGAKSDAKVSADDLARWKARAGAAINRRMPRGKGSGRVTLQVAFATSGSVTSANVIRSSGNDALDRSAVTAASGARLPPPPPGLRFLTVPIIFR